MSLTNVTGESTHVTTYMENVTTDIGTSINGPKGPERPKQLGPQRALKGNGIRPKGLFGAFGGELDTGQQPGFQMWGRNGNEMQYLNIFK